MAGRRSSWKGYLTIDLVAFQVQAFNAAERGEGEVQFHQLPKEPLGKESNEPYSLVYEAMDRMNRYAIGQIVLAGRDQLVLIRPYSGLLLMSMLNYHNQVRDAREMKLKLSSPSPKKLELAEKLIDLATEDRFDFDQYEDVYERRIKELIEARIKGREVVAPEEKEEPEVINLMDALRQSVAKVREGRPHLVRAAAKRRPAPKKRAKRAARKKAS